MLKSLWASVQGNPVFMRRVNGWLTVIWLAAAVPICLFLANSVPFLVFISVYAVVTGHLSSWQAARVEVVQDEDADVADVLAVVKEIRSTLPQSGKVET
jgi:hypothetical protein